SYVCVLGYNIVKKKIKKKIFSPSFCELHSAKAQSIL
ncbi:MAG: hypothetical protein ACI8RD_004489, partial [Bacillariaceae sp.]